MSRHALMEDIKCVVSGNLILIFCRNFLDIGRLWRELMLIAFTSNEPLNMGFQTAYENIL